MRERITQAPVDNTGHNDEPSNIDRSTDPRFDEVLKTPAAKPAETNLPSPPPPETEPGGQNAEMPADGSPSRVPRKKKRAKAEGPPAEKPALDPTPGKLNVESFLVPVGQEVAVTPAKQTVIPVKMVPKSAFFRVHPNKVLAGYLLDAEEEAGGREMPYLVLPAVAEQLNDPCIRRRHLYLAITLQKNLYLIPVSPESNDQWTTSKLIVLNEGRKGWIRVAGDKTLGAYSLTHPTVALAEPDWDSLKIQDGEILNTAFRGRLIDNRDHPRLKKLRGEG
jgi:hypothetical protein